MIPPCLWWRGESFSELLLFLGLHPGFVTDRQAGIRMSWSSVENGVPGSGLAGLAGATPVY